MIDDDQPGSILSDFETLLNFVEDGVRSTGKYHLLPMAKLFELDGLMTNPLRPRLKRPQQRSFPHLNGLYVLLRATQLGAAEGQGKSTGRLTLDPAMHAQWRSLNATERYFNLLEAWLRLGRRQMVGLGSGGYWDNIGIRTRDLWTDISAKGLCFSAKESRRGYLFSCTEQAAELALLELFGLVTVERYKPAEGEGWLVRAVRRTPFGTKLFKLVLAEIRVELYGDREWHPKFGVWQPLLQSEFPLWKNNLKIPEHEFRDGVFYFKVSLGTPWRRIAIPAESDLDALAESIIEAFGFTGNHLYGFHLTARDGRAMRVEHPYVDETDMYTDEVRIGDLPLYDRNTMLFQYDFGANWRFDVQLEKTEAVNAKIVEPTIVASCGKAPPEYDEW